MAKAILKNLRGEPAYLLASRVEDTHLSAKHAFDLAQTNKEHDYQTQVLHLFQQAKSWRLRAATSLARLWQQQGKCQDTYELLAPVYERFTEGFDKADLQEAKTLLEELA